jgi:hypothetical protein
MEENSYEAENPINANMDSSSQCSEVQITGKEIDNEESLHNSEENQTEDRNNSEIEDCNNAEEDPMEENSYKAENPMEENSYEVERPMEEEQPLNFMYEENKDAPEFYKDNEVSAYIFECPIQELQKKLKNLESYINIFTTYVEDLNDRDVDKYMLEKKL